MQKLYMNKYSSLLQITDVGNFEIKPLQTISTEDYPSLKDSLQFQHFVAVKMLIGQDEKELKKETTIIQQVQPFSLNQGLSQKDIDNIANQIIERLNSQDQNTQNIKDAEDQNTSNDVKQARLDIINHMLSSLPLAEQFGNLENEE